MAELGFKCESSGPMVHGLDHHHSLTGRPWQAAVLFSAWSVHAMACVQAVHVCTCTQECLHAHVYAFHVCTYLCEGVYG